MDKSAVTQDTDRLPISLDKRTEAEKEIDRELLRNGIFDLRLDTTNSDLAKVLERLDNSIGKCLWNVPMELPDGTKRFYDIEWDPTQYIPHDNTDETPHPASVEEIVKLFTAVTLETSDGSLHIIFPLGDISGVGMPDEETFCVVRVIDLQEFWVISDYSLLEHPYNTKFPGTGQKMTIGVLHGLFTGDLRLEVKDTGDFYVRSALRINGKIHATQGNKVVDISANK